MIECKHHWTWNSETNEKGWYCLNCDFRPGEPPGFSPQLDVEQCEEKVNSLLTQLHNQELLYISNADMGEAIVEDVVERCHQSQRYDQRSILEFILTDPNIRSDYWVNLGRQIREGNDPRKRCSHEGCGKLSVGGAIGGPQFCNEHFHPFRESIP